MTLPFELTCLISEKLHPKSLIEICIGKDAETLEWEKCNNILYKLNKIYIKKYVQRCWYNMDIIAVIKFNDLHGVKYVIYLENKLGRVDHDYKSVGIIWASQWGHLEIVKHFVEIGGDPRYRNSFALIYASSGGHLDTVKYLLSVGANIQAHGNLAIKEASHENHLEVVKYLVENGANVNDALHYASQCGHIDLIKYLVYVGAKI
jgi:ankyrin repeat protein